MQPTTVALSSELQQLGGAQFAPANFKTSTSETPQNAQFRIAVDPQGAVVYCFILASSGDTSLDELARQHLALARFPARAVPLAEPKPSGEGGSKVDGQPSDNDGLVWGIATIEWGNDVAAVNAKSAPNLP
jgi:hypothetical protein